jgi:hypothetical protein
MTQHTSHSKVPRSGSRRAGAGRFVVPLLIALLAAAPVRAHHDYDDDPHHSSPRGLNHHRGQGVPHDHYHAHAYHDVRPHQHTYTHTHWHTHELEDGTIIHHSHPHSHTYWHYGPDETEEERVTRVLEDQEKASPNDESPTPNAGTQFVEL